MPGLSASSSAYSNYVPKYTFTLVIIVFNDIAMANMNAKVMSVSEPVSAVV